MTRKPAGEAEGLGWKRGKDNGTEHLETLCHSSRNTETSKEIDARSGAMMLPRRPAEVEGESWPGPLRMLSRQKKTECI